MNTTTAQLLSACRTPAQREAVQRQLGQRTPKPSKYRNVRTVVDGISFHSKKEAARYRQLCICRDAGQCWFIRQPVFDTGGGTTYRADFLVVWIPGEFGALREVVIEDVKGMRTAAFKRTKRQVEALYPVKLTEL